MSAFVDMTTEKNESQRKRSRPVEKPKMMTIAKRNKTKVSIILVIIAMILLASFAVVYVPPEKKSNVTRSNNRNAVIDTSMGTIRILLYEDRMPITTANFIKLADDGFYNGMIFHRTDAGFMIQAGRYFPNGTQKFSSYGNIQFEKSNVTHVDGAISMASTGAKVGGSAEFFICDGAHDGTKYGLDGNYAAFGVVTQGLDVVHSIASTPNDGSLEPNPGGGKPLTDIVINSITIE
jgi:cyclophilin family peptidyl-prolyl cis-trans isomerase